MPHTEHSSSSPDIHLPLSSPDVFLSEYKSARDRLPEGVRAPLDALREEVMEICKTHGVDHPSKLVLAETHVSTETLERVQELLDQIHYIFEHQELPPALEKKEASLDDREYTLELDPDCPQISPAEDIHGKFVVPIHKGGKFVVIDQEGKTVGDANGYDVVRKFQDIGGKPGFIAEIEKKCFVVWKGKIAGDLEGYDHICSLTDIGGKPGFIAKQEGDRWFVFVDGKMAEGQEEYEPYTDFARADFMGVDGKPVYTAKADGREGIFIIKDGHVLGDPWEGYEAVSNLVDIGGQLGAAVKKNGRWFVLLEGEIIGNQEGYDHVKELTNIGGKIGFIAKMGSGETIVVLDRDFIHIKFGSVDCLRDIGGKVAYRIQTRDAKLVFYNGEIIGYDAKGPHEVKDIVDVAGRVGVIDRLGLSDWIFFGETPFLRFDEVLALRALDQDRFYVIAEEDKKIIKRVYSFSDPTLFSSDSD